MSLLKLCPYTQLIVVTHILHPNGQCFIHDSQLLSLSNFSYHNDQYSTTPILSVPTYYVTVANINLSFQYNYFQTCKCLPPYAKHFVPSP